MTIEQRKISQLPDVGTISGEEFFHIAFNGRSYKVTMNALVAHFTNGVDMGVVDRIRELVENLPDMNGYVTTEVLEQNLEVIRNTIPSLEGLASVEQVQAAIAHAVGQITVPEQQDLSGLATKQELQDAIESIVIPEIPEIPVIPDVSEFATRTEVQQAVAGIVIPQLPNMSEYATKQDVEHAISEIVIPDGADLTEYAKSADVTAQINEAVGGIQIPSVEGLVTTEQLQQAISESNENSAVDLSGLATKQEVQEAVASITIPEPQDLSGLATKQELQEVAERIIQPVIPDLSGYATVESVQQAIGEIQVPSIEGLATDERVNAVETRITEQVELKAVKTEVDQAIENLAINIQAAGAGMKNLSETSIGRILWVGPNATGEEYGSINRPFTSIQAAIDSTPENAQQYIILCAPGMNSNQNILFSGSRQSFQIQGFGCHDSHLVQIKGSVTVQGSAVTRFRMKDISILAQGSVPGMVFDSSAGRHYFDNVTVEKGAGHTGPLVEFRGTEARWSAFTQCCINGDIIVRDTVTPGQIVYFNMNNGNSHVTIEGNSDISVSGGFIGSIVAAGGNGAIGNISFVGNAAGEAIVNAGEGTYKARFANFEKADGTFLTTTGVDLKLCNDA